VTGERPDKDAFDARQIYCRRLGHYLGFSYCRSERNGLPCQSLRGCWGDKLPLEEYLRLHYRPGELAHLGEPPPDKTATLVELIRRAQQTASGKKKENSGWSLPLSKAPGPGGNYDGESGRDRGV